MQQVIDQFRDAMTRAGLTPPDQIEADGQLHRFSSNGRRGDMAGWYCLHLDGLPAGVFGDWRQGFSSTWCSKPQSEMTQADRSAIAELVKAVQAQRDAERQQVRAQARATAQQRWDAASPCTSHPYLAAKGVQAHGLRVTAGGLLMIPVRDASGTMQSLQTIAPDGAKRFQTGGQMTGGYHAIGRPTTGCIVVCEGYATGASIHAATGHAVAVAFNAGNLQAVAQALHRKYPSLPILVAADDDWQTEGNPGITKARQAAMAVGGQMVAPLFTCQRPAKATDFNDLHQLQGLAAVRGIFAEVEVYE